MKLRPQVPVRHPFGSSSDRRFLAGALVFRTFWRVLGVALLIGPASVLLANTDSAPSHHDDARLLVSVYAFEAFPQWASEHHEEPCPTSIDELSSFVARAPLDPWGTTLELRCGRGYRGAFVRSAGPDRTFDTADDISSHDAAAAADVE